MTKFTNKSFTVVLGTDAYRENYDRVFKKAEKETPSNPTTDPYLVDGMPAWLAQEITTMHERADRWWAQGDKAGASDLHGDASQRALDWYRANRPDRLFVMFPWAK